MISKRFAPDYQTESGWNPTGWRRDREFEGNRRRVRDFEGNRRRDRSFEGNRRARSTSKRRNNQNNLSEKEDEGKKNKSFKWLGMALSISSSASIAIGISNISIASNTLFTSSSDSGCFENSSFYDQLGPKNEGMKALNWTWISVGLWSAFFTYLAGLIVGKITKDSSTLKKFFMFAALISLIAFLPVRLILSVLDVLMSSNCQETNTPKFALPVALVVVAVIEFILLVIVFFRLRKQVKKWENSKIEKTRAPIFKASRPVECYGQPHEFSYYSRPAPEFQPVMLRPSRLIIPRPSPVALRPMQPMILQPMTPRWAPRKQAFFTPSLYQF